MGKNILGLIKMTIYALSSGPGISGPYSAPAIHPNGSMNLAIVPGSNPPLPISISSVNNGANGIYPSVNAQYFVDNSYPTYQKT